jgi:hypothetical protein
MAHQALGVPKHMVGAALMQAAGVVAGATAEANVVLLKVQAEAEPLRQQVQAFGGDGRAYAQFFFYQKVAPSIKSILTNSDGPFADVFKQFASPVDGKPTTRPAERGEKITGVQQ